MRATILVVRSGGRVAGRSRRPLTTGECRAALNATSVPTAITPPRSPEPAADEVVTGWWAMSPCRFAMRPEQRPFGGTDLIVPRLFLPGAPMPPVSRRKILRPNLKFFSAPSNLAHLLGTLAIVATLSLFERPGLAHSPPLHLQLNIAPQTACACLRFRAVPAFLILFILLALRSCCTVSIQGIHARSAPIPDRVLARRLRVALGHSHQRPVSALRRCAPRARTISFSNLDVVPASITTTHSGPKQPPFLIAANLA